MFSRFGNLSVIPTNFNTGCGFAFFPEKYIFKIDFLLLQVILLFLNEYKQ